jgi:hypothetical protein
MDAKPRLEIKLTEEKLKQHKFKGNFEGVLLETIFATIYIATEWTVT